MLEISKRQLKKIGDRIRNNEATSDDFKIISELISPLVSHGIVPSL